MRADVIGERPTPGENRPAPAAEHDREVTADHRAWIPGLDGLRAVAVIAVLLFHLNPDYLSGGFLGVDIFFVISGYLITRLLLTEATRTGRIRLGRFYLRRARRLLPAVLLLLAVVAAASLTIWRDQLPTLRGSSLSSLTYVTNWWLIVDQQSYFVAIGRPPMLEHLWSLAIEEQYYIVWAPLVILLAGAWLARRRVRPPLLVAGVALGLAVASTLAMTIIALRSGVPYRADSSRVYFGTDTHSMGLLLGSAAGALAAAGAGSLRAAIPRWLRRTPAWRVLSYLRRGLAPTTARGRRRRWWGVRPDGDGGHRILPPWASDTAALLGLAGLVWWMSQTDEFAPGLYRGGFLAFSALALLVVCAAARPSGRAGRWLDVAPLRWIGQRSYGIYLWHWPVLVATRPLIDVQGPAWLIDAARAGLAVAIAAASYRYVETPLRRGRPVARRGPAAGGAARHWLIPAIAAGCVATLLMGRFAIMQEQAVASSGSRMPLAGSILPDPPAPGGTATAAGQVATQTRGSLHPEGTRVAVTAPGGASVTAASAAGPVTGTAGGPVTGTAAGTAGSGPATATASPPTAPSTAPPPTSRPAPPRATPPPAAKSARSAVVSAFGDSVLLGASPALARAVGTLRLDAVVGRQAWTLLDVVAADHRAGTLAPIVLIHTGTNGIVSPQQLAGTLQQLRDRRQVILLNDHVDRTWATPNNRTIAAVAGEFKNVTLIDWNSAATAHPSWLGPDGIHVNSAGAAGYAGLVAAVIA